MTIRQDDSTLEEVTALLLYYGFDTKGVTVQNLIPQWLQDYSALWIRLAVIEALYLGRYKTISVEQILTVWNKKGTPNFRFSHEFECLICRNLPQQSAPPSSEPTINPFAPVRDNSKLFTKLKRVVSLEKPEEP